ncbi:MAG: haloacid dehalogenase-like hydrolase [Candidatus Iainarchaeum archaeon]|uniref:Haloacid dehalogenase-like hydrolase n=1 Tax=Candidatus Iainarchaeum sp. TaxID=3101447 RepID=A0A7T9DJ30_9ARCH|nr:MAG: haloacid dehalogenase-like hydrolase [Candidatus Diapherotrites archaeon]
MELPKMIRGKVKRARVLGSFVRNSLIFKLKRQALRPRYWFNRVSTIVVDMDGTLFDADAGNIGLQVAYPQKADGKTLGDIFYEELLHNLSSGKMNVEEVIYYGNQLLQDRSFTREDFEVVLKRMWPTLRKELVKALRQLKKQTHAKIILATLSSQEFAEMTNRELKKEFGFSFDGVIGSNVTFNAQGEMTGIARILGFKNGRMKGIPTRTKLSATKEWCKQHRHSFSMNQTVLITDSYGDIEMAKHVKTILLTPENPTLAQHVSERFKLADRIVAIDENLRDNIIALFHQSHARK